MGTTSADGSAGGNPASLLQGFRGQRCINEERTYKTPRSWSQPLWDAVCSFGGFVSPLTTCVSLWICTGLSFKIRVPSSPAEASEEHCRGQRSPRPRTAEHHQLLDPFLLLREVSAAASCFQEGEEVGTQEAVTWVGSGSHAKYRTNFWHGPTALWE